jgi:hypothetical protein
MQTEFASMFIATPKNLVIPREMGETEDGRKVISHVGPSEKRQRGVRAAQSSGA